MKEHFECSTGVVMYVPEVLSTRGDVGAVSANRYVRQ